MKIENTLHAHPDLATSLYVNPHSRSGQSAFSEIRPRIESELNLKYAALMGDVDSFLRQIRSDLDRGIERFLIGGGDGTLSLAASVLANTSAILGVVPVGTGNTFAQNIGMSPHIARNLPTYANGMVVAHDVGEAIKGEIHRIFINNASIGISERLVTLLTPREKKWFKWGAWFVHIGQAWKETPPFEVSLLFPSSRETHFSTRLFVIAKGRNLAGPIFAIPENRERDGKLHIFRIGDTDWKSFLRVSLKLIKGHHLSDKEAFYHETPVVTVKTTPNMGIDIDGDIWEDTPASFRVLPQSLNVLHPVLSPKR